jgi:ferric-dicitrate binding protein FerR (iron transport regulator)
MDKVSLIYRVLSGEASHEEAAVLDNWIKLSEANKEEFLNIKLLWENTPSDNKNDEESDKGLRKIKAKINSRRTRAFLQAATKIILILGAIIFSMLMIYSIAVRASGKGARLNRFHDISLRAMCDSLEVQYGVSIRLSPEIADCKFSGTFYSHSADMVLVTLSGKLKLNLEREDNRTFQLVGKACTSNVIIH